MGRSHSISCSHCGAMYGGLDGPEECPCGAIPNWSKFGDDFESKNDNGQCEACDKPIVYSEDGDDDEVCRRYKPYCLNHDNRVDWRKRALEARAEAERMRPVYEAALSFPDSYGGRLVKPPGDWACKECQPHSDWPNIDNGWRCPVHALLSAIHADATVIPSVEIEADRDRTVIAELRKENAQHRKDWDALLVEIALAVGDKDDREAAEMGEIEEFDPWHALRKVIAGRAESAKRAAVFDEMTRSLEASAAQVPDVEIPQSIIDALSEDEDAVQPFQFTQEQVDALLECSECGARGSEQHAPRCINVSTSEKEG